MRRLNIVLFLAGVVFPFVTAAQAPAGVPVVKIDQEDSSIRFAVKASVSIDGAFDKWDATMTFPSTDPESGVLDVKIQAASVHTGSGMKDGKLKGKDFFDVEKDPVITFHSNKVVQTGPTSFDVQGTFTIRGVSKSETLNLAVSGEGTGSGEVTGTMAFDRKDYGMNSGIPFIRVADRVEVTVDLKVKRVSGPPLAFKRVAYGISPVHNPFLAVFVRKSGRVAHVFEVATLYDMAGCVVIDDFLNLAGLWHILTKNLHDGLVRLVDSGFGKSLSVEEKHLTVIECELHTKARIAR